jgi:selenocysteine lyase/cysteine desulfurase
MSSSRRDLFDIPREVAYLNAASYSPLPRVTQEAARAAIANKAQPWRLAADFIRQQNEAVRELAARLIGAESSDVALIPSVGYGVASAAKLIDVPRGSRVLVLADDHASPVLEWHTRSAIGEFVVETVAVPGDGDWTSAVLKAIARKGAPHVALASISSVHWADGATLDMAAIAIALRREGAALLVDATQAAGAVPLDVRACDPDVLLFPTYKWLLGPYGRAFMYVAPRHQQGIPLEQNSIARMNVRAENDVYFGDLSYLPDARRFDMGERDHFISMPMTAASLGLVLEITPAAVAVHTRALTQRLAAGLAGLPVTLTPDKHRAPHILSLGFPRGMPRNLASRLAAANVHAAVRLGRLRLSPHVYNDGGDCDRAVAALRDVLAS